MAIYLDNAATTAVCPEAAEAAMRAMTACYGNPGAIHRLGREARALVEASRGTLARTLRCRPEELYFTSGGTESDNWAIVRGAEYQARFGRHIVSSAAEHPAVLNTLAALEARGWSVTRLAPEADGSVSAAALREALREDTCLVSLMAVNNETGAVTDLAAAAAVIRERSPHALFHTDAVQAYHKLPLRPAALGVDMVSLSGHKLHAPKGIGALYIRAGLNLPPLLYGGGQEGGRRSGTEPVPLIAALAAAAALDSGAAHMAALRSCAVERLTAEIPELLVLGPEPEAAAPQLLSVSLPGWRSETLMNFLEAREIYVAKSSACKRGRRSHVLEAMGLDAAVIDGAIRISLSRYTTAEEIDALCDGLRDARASLRPALRRR